MNFERRWRKEQRGAMEDGSPYSVNDKEEGVFWGTKKFSKTNKIDSPAYGVSLHSHHEKDNVLVLEKRYLLTEDLKESLDSKLEAQEIFPEKIIKNYYGIDSADELRLTYEVEDDLKRSYDGPEEVLQYFEERTKGSSPDSINFKKDFDADFAPEYSN